MTTPPASSPYPPTGAPARLQRHKPKVPPLLVWSTLGLMFLLAVFNLLLFHPRIRLQQDITNVSLLALAAAALILAIRRARGRTRIADAFFPLVLLNPLLYSYRHGPPPALDKTLLASGLLGIITAAIIAMKRDNLLRYFIITSLSLALTTVSPSFLMLIPALVIWLLYTGYSLSKSTVPRERVRGIVIMGCGELSLLIFGLACILEKPTPPPPPSTLFSTIVGFTDFPIIVLAIMLLALGWRKSPHTDTTPPHFAGMLALLVGLLTLLLNNFQYGNLPPPGADQTVLLLCLLYTVCSLHAPEKLHWLFPPALMLAAGAHALFR